jgi:hypothetical protein
MLVVQLLRPLLHRAVVVRGLMSSHGWAELRYDTPGEPADVVKLTASPILSSSASSTSLKSDEVLVRMIKVCFRGACKACVPVSHDDQRAEMKAAVTVLSHRILALACYSVFPASGIAVHRHP